MEEKSKLTVEYLISINSKNIFTNCSTKKAFNHLLCSNEKIKINGDKITYKELNINYKVQLTIKEKVNFFHMTFICDNLDNLNLYEEFLRGIKCVLNKVSDNGVIVLWDDISIYYCKQSYPLLNRIENTMRKLLTKFMMINIGEDWDKTVISDEIKKSIAKKENNYRQYDYLYKTDFITLSDFLFKEYPNKTYENFNKEIKKSKKINDFNIEDIIKKSNWDRYFSKIVECEGEFLNTRWKELYELRCKVAHNNQLEKNEYERIIILVDEIAPKLEGVMRKLDEVNVDENFKSRVVENIVENIYPDSMYFLNQYKTLEEILTIMSTRDGKIVRYPVFVMARKLYTYGIIDDETFDMIKQITDFRNELVHGMNFESSDAELTLMINHLIECHNILLNNPKYIEAVDKIS